MRKLGVILGSAVLLLAVIVGWRVGSCELANIELQDDMKDLASQLGARAGYTKFSSEQDLRDTVIRKGLEHGIELKPNQVTAERTGDGKESTVYLAADYKATIDLPYFSFALHFTPSGGTKRF